MDRGAGSPFAQIIETGNEQDPLVVAEDGNLEAVPPGHGAGGQETALVRRFREADQARAVVLLIDSADVRRGGGSFSRGQGDGDLHAGVIRRHDGTEDGVVVQTADLCHFRQVLVGLAQAVLPGCLIQRIHIRRFILGDHFLSAAGVSGE